MTGMRRMIFALLALLTVSSIAAPALASTCAPCADDDYDCELYKCASPQCSTAGNCTTGACQPADIPTSAMWESTHPRTLALVRVFPVNERSLEPPKPPPQHNFE